MSCTRLILLSLLVVLQKVASDDRWTLKRGGNRLGDYISYASEQLTNPGTSVACAWIFAKDTASRGQNDYAAFFYEIDATLIRGRRVRLRALIRVKGVDDGAWAGLFMRIDSASGQVLAFDNMMARPITGTTPTYSYGEYHEVVLDVPGKHSTDSNPACEDPESQATSIVLGGFLAGGKGFLAMSEVRFLEASTSPESPLPTSSIPQGPGLRDSLGSGLTHEEFNDEDNERWINYCNTRGNPTP